MKTYLKWCIMKHELLDTCNCPYFQAICGSLSSKAIILNSDMTLMEALKMKDQMKNSIIELGIGKFFALTADHWMSASSKAYAAASLHFIGNDWESRSLTLACDPHSGEQTGFKMHCVLKTAWE